MPFLSREAILTAQDRTFKEVEVAEWGGEVRIGTLSALQHDRWITAANKLNQANGSSVESARALLVAMSVVDEHGKPLFTEKDVEALSQRNTFLLDKLVTEIVKLNSLTTEQQKEQKAF